MVVHRAASTPDKAKKDFERLAEGVLHHDSERGFMLWKDNPNPTALIQTTSLYQILLVLENVVSYPSARGFCREIGHRHGLALTRARMEALKPKDGHRVDTLLELPRAMAAWGWGVSRLHYDEKEGKMEWTFPNGTAIGVAAELTGPRTKPACALIEGFGAGWIRGSAGLEVELLEDQCVALGHEACRFKSRHLFQ